MQRLHSSDEAELCKAEGCLKTFKSKIESKMHYNRVHGNMERKFPCTDCDKRFYQTCDLKAHIKGVHLKIKDHICQYCQKSYSQKPNLTTHIKRAHTDVSTSNTHID